MNRARNLDRVSTTAVVPAESREARVFCFQCVTGS